MIYLYFTFERVHSTWPLARKEMMVCRDATDFRGDLSSQCQELQRLGCGMAPSRAPTIFPFALQSHWGNGRKQALSSPDFKTATVKFHYHHNLVHSFIYLFIYLFPCWRKKIRKSNGKKPNKKTTAQSPMKHMKTNKEVGHGTSALNCAHLA